MFQISPQMLWALLSTVGLIALDTLLGWVKAIVKGEWDWHKVGRFLMTSVLPYVASLLALAVLTLLQPNTVAVFYTSVAAADVQFVADIFAKAKGFGFPVQNPEVTTGEKK